MSSTWPRNRKRRKRLYGIDSKVPSKRLYGIQCLRARRLVESGVRFVEITCPPGASNGTWDQHGDLKKGHEKNALDTDQAIAGLIKDLKQRGLLDETLVVWAGEFGRTPHSAGRDGRDHHPEGFSVWLAGGGVKGGTIYGATDDMGMHAVEQRLHHARPARHDPAPAGHRSRPVDVPLQRPRLSAHRRARQCGERGRRLSRGFDQAQLE